MSDPTLLLAAGSGVTELIDGLGVNVKALIAQIIAFTIVAVLLWRLAFKPIVATVEERQKTIAEGLEHEKLMRAKLTEAQQKHEEILRQATQESQAILAKARLQAKELLDRETASAARKVEDMLARGRQANELEREKMLSELRQEIARLVVSVSGKVLARDLSESEKSRLNQSAAVQLAGQN